MSDRIVQCVVRKNESDVVIGYDFNYEVENPADESQKHTILVTVLAADMSDPNSESEAKTIANTAAATAKAAWLESLEPVSANADDVPSVVGDVTL